MRPPRRRTRRHCAGLAEQRSALVDGALSSAERERLLIHMVSCAPCRADVAELRRLRQLLSGSGHGSTPISFQFSDRLVSIAGSRAAAPLWSRPFMSANRDGSRFSGLSRSRPVGARVACLAAAVLVALAVPGLGLAAAPPGVSAIDDPTTEARAEFGAVAAQLPLAGDPISAVLSNPQRTLTNAAAAGNVATSPRLDTTSRQLSPAAAVEVLSRAAAAVNERDYSGTQLFRAVVGGHEVTATIRVDSRAGRGREISVYDRFGDKLTTSFTPATSASRVRSDQQMSLLTDNYVITGWRGGEVAGRAAIVIEAASQPAGVVNVGAAVPAARWWVDEETGLLLWTETRDSTGAVAMSAGYQTIAFGWSDFRSHLPPKFTPPLTHVSLMRSSTDWLSAAGWTCPEQLAGLTLVRVRSDQATHPNVLHLAYSDGLSTVSVFEQRGRLPAAPVGMRWDEQRQAYLSTELPNVATWASGGFVFTVVTDGSLDLLSAAAASLPHEAETDSTTMERVQAGWARILDAVMG